MNRFATRRPRLHCALFALLLFAAGNIATAHAQTAIYGQFNASHLNLSTTNEWGYGGGFGLYSDFKKLPFAKVGVDLRLQFVRPAANTNLISVLVGPRLALHPKVIPLDPYIECIFGPGHFSFGNNAPSTTQFDFRVIGGLDKTVKPHLDWRVIEVSYGQINTFSVTSNSGRLRPITLGTGIVLRFH
jgi:hypothetical protein